mmetsp:Transcript_65988/g.157790  ORF Transcript_65988/g.157790 Transcript_65988/m.157790 type:complete len:436 (-) Transcript_65988:1474-2781(-)
MASLPAANPGTAFLSVTRQPPSIERGTTLTAHGLISPDAPGLSSGAQRHAHSSQLSSSRSSSSRGRFLTVAAASAVGLHVARRRGLRPVGRGCKRSARIALRALDPDTASSLTTAAGPFGTPSEDALAALLALNAAVLFHESGHFFCARTVSLPAEEFSIGFGPALLGYGPKNEEGKGTEFVLRLLPIGGYVRFNDEKKVQLPDGTRLNEFEALPAVERLWVLAGGVVANIITAWSTLCAASLSIGLSKTDPLPGVRIKDVPAEAVERTRLLRDDVVLRIGDLDLSAPGQRTDTTVDFIHRLPAQTPVELLVQRGSEEFTLQVVPLSDADTGFQRLGVTIIPNADSSIVKAEDLQQAIMLASENTQRILSEQITSLQNILSRTGPGEVIGPVGIIEQGERLAQELAFELAGRVHTPHHSLPLKRAASSPLVSEQW